MPVPVSPPTVLSRLDDARSATQEAIAAVLRFVAIDRESPESLRLLARTLNSNPVTELRDPRLSLQLLRRAAEREPAASYLLGMAKLELTLLGFEAA